MSQDTVKKVNVIKKGNRYINKSRTIPEVFDVVAEAETKEEKVALLQAYNTKALKYVINAMYNVDWSGMPVPKVTFNHRPPEICNANISNSLKRIESAYRNRDANPQIAKKNLTMVLEEVSEREAKLLINIFKGRKVPGISKAVFKEAYPAFFRSDEDEKEATQTQETSNRKVY